MPDSYSAHHSIIVMLYLEQLPHHLPNQVNILSYKHVVA